MKLPAGSPELVEFRCNICGGANRLKTQEFHRETALCTTCGSNARFRGIVGALAEFLKMADYLPLREWPARRDVHGIGMSDWPGYADLLAKRFSYQNSFYDREPRLDIQNPTAAQLGKYDFVISTDVFEHVLQPIQQAFDNLLALLKPGGCLIFSVPYTRTAQTLEHFPGLREFEFFDFRGTRILVNRDEAGELQVHENLIFHGGEGATLEMRLFCETDVLDRLAKAGFTDVRVHETPKLDIGYYWPELPHADPQAPLYAYIISARRPS